MDLGLCRRHGFVRRSQTPLGTWDASAVIAFLWKTPWKILPTLPQRRAYAVIALANRRILLLISGLPQVATSYRLKTDLRSTLRTVFHLFAVMAEVCRQVRRAHTALAITRDSMINELWIR